MAPHICFNLKDPHPAFFFSLTVYASGLFWCKFLTFGLQRCCSPLSYIMEPDCIFPLWCEQHSEKVSIKHDPAAHTETTLDIF